MSAGKFVAIHGTVIRVSNVKPLVKKMAFSCNLCSETQVSISGVFACCFPFSLLLPLLHFLSFSIQVLTALLLSLSLILPCSLSPLLSLSESSSISLPFFSPSFPLFLLHPLPTCMYLLFSSFFTCLTPLC